MSAPAVVGWREWVALPELGLPAVEAKVDTGARTSVLHAFAMDVFEEAGRRRVCFGVHPLRGDARTAVYACADVVDERLVTSSNGEEELRVVIRTPLVLAGRAVPVELSLSDRSRMTFRMLLGRTALAGLLVKPAAEFLLGAPTEPERLYAE